MAAPTKQLAGGEKQTNGRWSLERLLRSRFLVISIAFHVLLILVATYLVVQTITTKRKQTFKAGPPSAPRPVEHQIQVVKQKQLSAPMPTTRIRAKGPSVVNLPDMPDMPSSQVSPTAMTGVAASPNGMPTMAPAAPGGAGVAIPFFGALKPTTGSLTGTFYDLKQTKGRKPTDMNPQNWWKLVNAWVAGKWDPKELDEYYAGPKPLYAPFIFIPTMSAAEGPKAFNLEGRVQPRLWIIHYKGQVTPSSGGRYRFVGTGDDCLFVRFNGKVVLGTAGSTHAMPPVNYKYEGVRTALVAGTWFTVNAGSSYDMEVLIGECPGGLFYANLLLEKSNGHYEKTPEGSPILPLFRLGNASPAEMTKAEIERQKKTAGGWVPLLGKHPPFSTKESPWGGGKGSTGSLLSR